jgi:hypothetical protein
MPYRDPLCFDFCIQGEIYSIFITALPSLCEEVKLNRPNHSPQEMESEQIEFWTSRQHFFTKCMPLLGSVKHRSSPRGSTMNSHTVKLINTSGKPNHLNRTYIDTYKPDRHTIRPFCSRQTGGVSPDLQTRSTSRVV